MSVIVGNRVTANVTKGQSCHQQYRSGFAGKRLMSESVCSAGRVAEPALSMHDRASTATGIANAVVIQDIVDL